MNKLFTINTEAPVEETPPVVSVSFDEAIAGLEELVIEDTATAIDIAVLDSGVAALESLGDIVTRLDSTENLTPELLATTQAHVNYITKSLGDDTEIVGIENFDDTEILAGLEEKKDSILSKIIATIRRIAASTLKKLKDNVVSKYITAKFSAIWKVLANIPKHLEGKKVEVALGFTDISTFEITCKAYNKTMNDIGKLLESLDVDKMMLHLKPESVLNDSRGDVYFNEFGTGVVDKVNFTKNKFPIAISKEKKYKKIIDSIGVETKVIGENVTVIVKTHPVREKITKTLEKVNKVTPSTDQKEALKQSNIVQLLEAFASYADKVPHHAIASLANIAKAIKAEQAKKDEKSK